MYTPSAPANAKLAHQSFLLGVVPNPSFIRRVPSGCGALHQALPQALPVRLVLREGAKGLVVTRILVCTLVCF